MELDHDQCYQAILSRDRRFDGRFYTGVVTTGIYCRPVCPATPPKQRNVRFYACAAAAEEAGFRPCKRCRPEVAVASPAWPDAPAVVVRALHLINEGALDDGGVEDLADRLAIGSRQLRRLFVTHLGAAPLSIAKARRVHFARKLLDETALSVTEVAFAAGFKSLRQFNLDVRRTFGEAPRALRRGSIGARVNGSGLVVRLPSRQPFDAQRLLGFIAMRAIQGVEVVDGLTYRRTVEVAGSAGMLEMQAQPHDGSVLLRLRLPSYEGLIQMVERARRIFDLGADPASIDARLAEDEALAPLIAARPGMRVPGAWDPFETSVRAVLGQQISVRAASTLAARVVEAFGKPLEGFEDLGLTHLFPSPEVLAEADVREVGTTGAQARTIAALARAVVSGELRFDAPLGADDLVARLCALPGIGDWTAQYIAMRACGEPDAFPAGDLGLRRALGETSSARDLAARAEAWRPWRAYAAMHLWTHDNERRSP